VKEPEEFMNTLFDRLDLDDKQNKLCKELSKGMQQKVSICCAAIIRPKIIFMDEPMVGLDPHPPDTLWQPLDLVSEILYN
jgi:ABC-2 type transport system ATP-binding protein